MGRKKHSKKNTPKKTPRRTSLRKRMRTEKGSYYHEHFEECTGLPNTDASNLGKSIVNPVETAVAVQDQTTNGSIRSHSSEEVEGSSANPEGSQGSNGSKDEDHTMNVGDTSEEINNVNQRTPELLDLGNVTPVVANTDSTTPRCCEFSTPAAICKTPISLKAELELALSALAQENSTSNNNNDSGALQEDWIHCQDSNTFLLNNIFELHNIFEWHNIFELHNIIHQPVSYNPNSADLQKKINEQADTIQYLKREKETQKLQVEKLGAELFKKEQKLKITADRIKQLENSEGYRREVERLEETVEQGKCEMKVILEEKQKVIRQLKASEDRKNNNMERLQECERKLKNKEDDIQSNLKIIQDLEKSQEEMISKIEETLEDKNRKIRDLENELRRNQDNVARLEENKTFLLNQNTILKNEAKVLKQKNREGEETQNHSEEEMSNDEQGTTGKKLQKKLNELQREMKSFKEFTFQRLDQLAGRGGSSSSMSSNSSVEQESGVDSESSTDVRNGQDSVAEPPKRKTPPRRKQWSDVGNIVGEVPPGLRYEGNNSPTAELSPDESRRTTRVVPGHGTYSEMVRGSTVSPETSDYDGKEKAKKIEAIRSRRAARESKTLIFSSSITRDISRQQPSFNKMCGTSDVRIHEFKGKKASDIVKYMIPHLEEEQPASVVFVAGGNDLPTHDVPMVEIRKIANCLVEGGLACRGMYGVRKVYISSIMPRENSNFQGNRHRLNNLLRGMCKEMDFIFIENKNIVLSAHGHHDGVHLNFEGSNLLRDNLVTALNR